MSLEGAAVSLGATLVSLAFAALAFNQWLAESSAGTEDVYRVYYLLAAPLVAVLGAGSTFLVSRRLGYAFSVYTAVLFIGFAWVVLTSPVNTAALAAQAIPGGRGFSGAARGSLARCGPPWALSLGEFAGVALMFWGFLASQDLAKAPRPTAPKAA